MLGMNLQDLNDEVEPSPCVGGESSQRSSDLPKQSATKLPEVLRMSASKKRRSTCASTGVPSQFTEASTPHTLLRSGPPAGDLKPFH